MSAPSSMESYCRRLIGSRRISVAFCMHLKKVSSSEEPVAARLSGWWRRTFLRWAVLICDSVAR